MSTEYLSFHHLSKTFQKDPVLKDISATLERGHILGFLGPSGAGKTTTIKILTGQLRPSSGEAYVLGKRCQDIDESIYERLSVYDNLKYFARLLNVPLSNIPTLLKRIGLYEHRKKAAAKLSKGQTQRLILARAILHRPRVLFLDEPTSGLDPATSMEIHKMLLELKDAGMAIFLTTHNMEEAAKLCDNVALLNEGIIVEYGNPKDICLRHNIHKRYRVRLHDGSIHELAQSEESARVIANWLVQDQIETIHSCEPTLETVFLSATGRSLS